MILYDVGLGDDRALDTDALPEDYMEWLAEENAAIAAAIELQEKERVEASMLRLARLVKSLESDAETLSRHVADTQARLGRVNARIDNLKDWMKGTMLVADLPKVKDALVSVWVQASPASVEIIDEAAVPVEYKRATLVMPLAQVPADYSVTSVQVLKAQIMADAKETGVIPDGVEIHADHKHLRIK